MNVLYNAACPICGCICDDLELSLADGQLPSARITEVRNGCQRSRQWFLDQSAAHPAVAEVAGQGVEISEAVERAAELLGAAPAPLIMGLSDSSTPGYRAAVRLAESIRATIDPAAAGLAQTTWALQEVGQSTCTLGEVKNRADLVIFWGADPLVTHPRLWERHAVDPPGEFIPRGRADRTVVTIDSEPTETARRADEFLPLEDNCHFDAIWSLRALVRGAMLEVDSSPDTEQSALANLATRMKTCRYGVIFFGAKLLTTRLAHRNVEALLQLVRDLNAYTRFSALSLGMPGDAAGADEVLTWQTGYPLGVNFSRGMPRYSPGEFAANTMLERGEADACLLVGGEAQNTLSPAAKAQLAKIPTIVLDLPAPLPIVKQQASRSAPAVRITTAVYGIHLAGTAYRLDSVPIPLRQALSTKYPSDAELLDMIRERVTQRRGIR